MAQHAPPDERFRLSVKTLNAVSVIITCKPTDGRWRWEEGRLIDSSYLKKKKGKKKRKAQLFPAIVCRRRQAEGGERQHQSRVRV